MQIDPSRLSQIDRAAQKHVSAGEFSSVEWVVEFAGSTVSRGAIGKADALNAIALPNDPLYRIYSMTKSVVSVLTLQLIEEGLLGLAHPVALYLPAAASLKVLSDGKERAIANPVTIEHLLTHRAGFSYDFLPDCPVGELYRNAALAEDGDRTLVEMVDVVLDFPLVAEPGSQWRYSVSIDVLARVLEVVTGKSLPDLLEERLFEPCGMRDTAFSLSTDQRQRLMPMFGQKPLGEPIQDIPEVQRLYAMDVDAAYPVCNSRFVRGGLGLYSSLNDFHRFLSVITSGKTSVGEVLLSAPMVELMWQNRISEVQMPLAIGFNTLPGYGWNLFGRVMVDTGQALSLTAHGEGGWAGAAATYFWVDRDTHLNGVVMTQYLGATVPIGDIIRHAAYQSLVH